MAYASSKKDVFIKELKTVGCNERLFKLLCQSHPFFVLKGRAAKQISHLQHSALKHPCKVLYTKHKLLESSQKQLSLLFATFLVALGLTKAFWLAVLVSVSCLLVSITCISL